MSAGILRWCRARGNGGGCDRGTGKDPDGARVQKLKSEPRALKQRGERLAGLKPRPCAFRVTRFRDLREIEKLQTRLLTKGGQRLIERLGPNVDREPGGRGRTGRGCRDEAQGRAAEQHTAQVTYVDHPPRSVGDQ